MAAYPPLMLRRNISAGGEHAARTDDATLDFLLARSGLAPTPKQKAELKAIYPACRRMAERVRKPRGRMAELAHTYGFTAEDLHEHPHHCRGREADRGEASFRRSS